ncbi:phage major tail tube protein [Sulfurimonas sp.]|uniref:phage major tail tube protein n=1 Tax=Sulfurimonas sp. TaxID=2022749 RepID=UPI0025F0F928|nr:phage major tail tube protein [Sulfurimonas sp.]
MDRSVVVDVNVFFGGYGSLGISESFKAPAIKYKKLKQTGAVGDREIAYGALESLDGESTFKAMPKAVYTELSKLDEAEIIYKKAISTAGVITSYEWVCKGAFDLEYGESKAGEFLDVKITQKGMKAYTHEIGGVEMLNIDHENIICKIDGKDLLADVRNAIKG